MFMRRLKIKPSLSSPRLRTTPCSSPVVGGIEKLSDISPLNIEVDESRTHSEIGNIDILGKEIKIEELEESGILECCTPQLTVPSEIDESLSISSETIVNHKEETTSDIAPSSPLSINESIENNDSGVISDVICDKVVETILEVQSTPTILSDEVAAVVEVSCDRTESLDTSVSTDLFSPQTYTAFPSILEEASNLYVSNEVTHRPPIAAKALVRKPDREIKRPRRHFNKAKEPPERSKMTMVDLIYYNPTDNPMKRPEKNPVAVADTKEKGESSSTTPSTAPAVERNNNEAVVAPRVKIDEFGQIIIDEESLVIQHAVPEGFNSVTEDSETTYFSFRNRATFKKWSSKETLSFYRALLIVGTDFALMSQLMKTRSREELKLKYKKEEKKHAELVHKIVRASSVSDYAQYQQEVEDACDSDGSLEKKKKRRKKPAAPSAKKVTRVSNVNVDAQNQGEVDVDDNQGNKKRKKRKKAVQSQKNAASKKGTSSINDNAEHQQEAEDSCDSDEGQGRKMRKANPITYSKQPAGSKIVRSKKKKKKVQRLQTISESEDSSTALVNENMSITIESTVQPDNMVWS